MTTYVREASYLPFTMKNLCGLAVCVAFLPLLLMLAGCGVATPAGPSAAGVAALTGNWVVTGVIPQNVFPLSSPLSRQSPFNLAMTLDVVNGQVLAQASYFYQCMNSAGGGAGAVSAAMIAADGTFTFTSPTFSGVEPTISMTIHGVVPKTAGESWTGTYSATNGNTGCSPVSGSFTATPIPPVTGTYAGTVSLGAPHSALVTAPTVAIAFQQGGPASLDPPTGLTPLNSVNALSGSITVTNSTCFTSGTATLPTSSQMVGVGAVYGDLVETQFNMNDGSRLFLIGNIASPDASSIQLSSLSVTGGSCDGWFGGSGSILTRK